MSRIIISLGVERSFLRKSAPRTYPALSGSVSPGCELRTTGSRARWRRIARYKQGTRRRASRMPQSQTIPQVSDATH
jgi:hypothetical protein